MLSKPSAPQVQLYGVGVCLTLFFPSSLHFCSPTLSDLSLIQDHDFALRESTEFLKKFREHITASRHTGDKSL